MAFSQKRAFWSASESKVMYSSEPQPCTLRWKRLLQQWVAEAVFTETFTFTCETCSLIKWIRFNWEIYIYTGGISMLGLKWWMFPQAYLYYGLKIEFSLSCASKYRRMTIHYIWNLPWPHMYILWSTKQFWLLVACPLPALEFFMPPLDFWVLILLQWCLI